MIVVTNKNKIIFCKLFNKIEPHSYFKIIRVPFKQLISQQRNTREEYGKTQTYCNVTSMLEVAKRVTPFLCLSSYITVDKQTENSLGCGSSKQQKQTNA